MLVPFEELEECRTFARVDTPAFLDNESRNAQTKVIDVGYLSSLCNPSSRTIERLVSRSSRVGNAAGPEITLQLLMKTEVAPTGFFRIVRTKKRQ